jgi:radical S-adenosyl methionine domain-containing protein 2
MGVSCDSFDNETNLKIGRSDKGKGIHKNKAFQVAEWCRGRAIMFKMNTVVNRYNWEEDMNDGVAEINPFRWKVTRNLLSHSVRLILIGFRYSKYLR